MAENLPVHVDQKPVGVKQKLSDAEKKNFLADQKANDWSNKETADRAGVSEATVRRWREKFTGKKDTGGKKTMKRPASKAKKPTTRNSRSVTRLREELEAEKAKNALLEAELAVVKPLAKFYFN